jgi:hypothetical protein
MPVPKKRKLAYGYYECDGSYIVCICGAWNTVYHINPYVRRQLCSMCDKPLYRNKAMVEKEIAALKKELAEFN